MTKHKPLIALATRLCIRAAILSATSSPLCLPQGFEILRRSKIAQSTGALQAVISTIV
jgi:hypothetical protein